MGAEERLKEMGIALPEPPSPVGAYVPYVRSGDLLFISGQIPLQGGSSSTAGRWGPR
ncbi:MAG: hypothetical protein V3V62_15005 [bacterium]